MRLKMSFALVLMLLTSGCDHYGAYGLYGGYMQALLIGTTAASIKKAAEKQYYKDNSCCESLYREMYYNERIKNHELRNAGKDINYYEEPNAINVRRRGVFGDYQPKSVFPPILTLGGSVAGGIIGYNMSKDKSYGGDAGLTPLWGTTAGAGLGFLSGMISGMLIEGVINTAAAPARYSAYHAKN